VKSTVLPVSPITPNQQSNTIGNQSQQVVPGANIGVYIFISLVLLLVIIILFLFWRFGFKALDFYKRISPLMWLVSALLTGGFALRLIDEMKTIADIMITVAAVMCILFLIAEFKPDLIKFLETEQTKKPKNLTDEKNNQEK
jgi:hypothetical protein